MKKKTGYSHTIISQRSNILSKRLSSEKLRFTLRVSLYHAFYDSYRCCGIEPPFLIHSPDDLLSLRVKCAVNAKSVKIFQRSFITCGRLSMFGMGLPFIECIFVLAQYFSTFVFTARNDFDYIIIFISWQMSYVRIISIFKKSQCFQFTFCK